MSIALTNTSGRLKAFTLSHESYCAARGQCACASTPGRNPRRVPSSLTLAAGIRLDDVDEAVLVVPDIERSLRVGELRIERKSPSQGVAPAANAGASNRRANKKTRGDA